MGGGCGDGAPSPWGQPVWGLRCSCPRRELVLPLPTAPRPPRAGCSLRGAGGEAKKGSRGCAYHGADAVRGGGADGVVVGVCRCVHSAVTRSKHGGVLETRGGVLHPQQLPRGCCTLFPPPTTPWSPHQGPTTNSPDPGGTGSRGHPDIASSILTARSTAAGLDGAGGEMGTPPIPSTPPPGRGDARGQRCLPVAVCCCCCCRLGVSVGGIAPLQRWGRQREAVVRVGAAPTRPCRGSSGGRGSRAPPGTGCRDPGAAAGPCGEPVLVPPGTHQPHYHSPGAFTNINLKKLNF